MRAKIVVLYSQKLVEKPEEEGITRFDFHFVVMVATKDIPVCNSLRHDSFDVLCSACSEEKREEFRGTDAVSPY